MPRKHFRKYLPDHDSVRENRVLRFFGPVLGHHNLWHLHRRSVAGGVAVGMFAGLIPGPVQWLFASIFAVIFRVNLPVAVFTTFYTNPLTFVPLYFVAYKIGVLITGQNNGVPEHFPQIRTEGIAQWLPAFIDWLTSLGKPLLVGLPILGILLAAGSYFLVRGLWRLYVVIQWRSRSRKRKAAQGQK